jgi:hypothetical protein
VNNLSITPWNKVLYYTSGLELLQESGTRNRSQSGARNWSDMCKCQGILSTRHYEHLHNLHASPIIIIIIIIIRAIVKEDEVGDM